MKRYSTSKTRSPHNGTSTAFRALTVAGVALVAVLLVAPAASAATPAPVAHRHVGDSNPVNTLNNLSPYPVTLSSASGNWDTAGAPSQNKVYTGYTSDWSVALEGGDGDFTVGYQFADASGAINTVTTSLTDSGRYSTGNTACTVTGPDAADWTCDHSTGWYSGNINFTLHASKKSLQLSQVNKNAFAQALSSMCDGPHGANGHATCAFNTTAAPTYQLSLHGQPPADAKDLPGCYKAGNNATYGQEDSVSTTTSYDTQIGTSASVGIDGVVTLGISDNQTWGKAWTDTKQYSYQQPMHADYRMLAIPNWFPNVATLTGDFTATLDGTTFNLTNVQITGSGVAGGGSGNYVTSQIQKPMTNIQYNAWCAQANIAH